ncbi:molybdate ABC transporter substrate-binding protein [Aquimarina sp. 2201CG1-2-11]|uniref:molybdate ABC transporter substrate-binding protein n=1 Tax=Aquimarina discodermiae TaxID=3231043 RepID=UPI003461D34E
MLYLSKINLKKDRKEELMTKKAYLYGILLILLSISCSQKQDSGLTIAAASNMQFAIKQLSKTFTIQTGIPCTLVISSSGKLTAQIKEGAPFDVFMSADEKYPKELFETGRTNGAPKIYGYGKLVLWSMHKDIDVSLGILSKPNVRHIAIANPKTAPYGVAAVEVLRKHNLYDTIQNKLVYGESISQANQFIVSKSAEIGFTSKSVVLSSQIKNKGKWISLDEDDYSKIAQAVVVIKQEVETQKKAKKFYNFLSSASAKKILEEYGYSTP